jgi:hypothetical protein
MFSIESNKNCLHKLFCLSGLLFALLFSSCEKDEVLNEPVSEQQTVSSEIRLGAKVESPFLLRNMQRSVDSLSARSGLKSLTILKPTHLYVRFLPADTAQYERLVADTTLDFDPYPLDYQLTEGDSYHDPSLPAEAITWQYTVVPADYDLKGLGITCEVLDELYILDEDLEREDISVGDTQLRSGKGSGLSWKSVVDEALIQTGNVGETTLRSKWTPAATIKAYDDRMGKYIPLQGVKVRIRYFAFLKAYHYTDANGNVTFSSKRTSVEYSIEWERDMWDIRDDGTQAYYHGPDQKGKWNLNINTGTPKSLHYSAIHRALYKYYYGDCCGLVRPSKSLKISYQEGSDPDKEGTALGSTASAKVRTWNWIFSAIKIYGKGKIIEDDKVVGEYIQTVSGVFTTTLHELAHASHACRMSRSGYDETSQFIKDSWAVAVEWYLMLDEYRKLGISASMLEYLDDLKNEQVWPDVSRSIWYSSLYIDLVDSYNQGKYNDERPFDEVSGYTMPLIDSKLTSMKSYIDVENFVKNNRPSNVTYSQINNLLKLYKQKWEN